MPHPSAGSEALYRKLPRYEQIVWDAEDDVQRDADCPDWSPYRLAEPLLTVWAVTAVQEKTNNGSIHHFFEFDWPEFPPYELFIDALERIGATEAKQILSDAVAAFPLANPERDVEARRAIINASIDEFEESEEGSPFDEWGHRLIDLNDENYRLLSEYILANGSYFPTVGSGR